MANDTPKRPAVRHDVFARWTGKAPPNTSDHAKAERQRREEQRKRVAAILKAAKLPPVRKVVGVPLDHTAPDAGRRIEVSPELAREIEQTQDLVPPKLRRLVRFKRPALRGFEPVAERRARQKAARALRDTTS